ncbi:MAG: hypothetical protein O7G83_08685, partial [Proteobacteria bacterium]|nr:hypothetical protein [Pseudomonadota bacterium]
PDDSSPPPKMVAHLSFDRKVTLQPDSRSWDGALDASETSPRRNRIRENGHSANTESPAPAGSRLLRR